MDVMNLNTKSRNQFLDDFDQEATGVNALGATGSSDNYIHIRIQQRNGRKTLTTVQGISSDYDLKKMAKALKKEFNCNGTVVEHAEYGEVIQMQGDQRVNIESWLQKIGLVTKDQIKVHGF